MTTFLMIHFVGIQVSSLFFCWSLSAVLQVYIKEDVSRSKAVITRNLSACILGLIHTSHVFLCTRLVTCLRGDVSAYHSYQIFLKVRSTKQQKSNDIQVTESQNHKVNWRHCAVWHVKTCDIFVKDLISTPLSSSPFHPSPVTRHRSVAVQSWTLWKRCRFGRKITHQYPSLQKGFQQRQIGVLGLDQKGHLSWMIMLSAQFVKWIEWCLSTNCSALDKPSQFTICLFLAMKSVASHDSARPERHIDERCWRVLGVDSSF